MCAIYLLVAEPLLVQSLQVAESLQVRPLHLAEALEIAEFLQTADLKTISMRAKQSDKKGIM